jgi:hypothetical protein
MGNCSSVCAVSDISGLSSVKIVDLSSVKTVDGSQSKQVHIKQTCWDNQFLYEQDTIDVLPVLRKQPVYSEGIDVTESMYKRDLNQLYQQISQFKNTRSEPIDFLS